MKYFSHFVFLVWCGSGSAWVLTADGETAAGRSASAGQPASENVAKNPTSIRPVLMMHGLVSGSVTLELLRDRIIEAHPDVRLEMVEIFSYERSIMPCSIQVAELIEVVRNFSTGASEGITIICYSQGSILCRALIEEMDDHKVHTFISLGGPMAGQFGMTDFLRYWLPGATKYDLYKFFYSWFGQRYSFANYWKDPLHYEDYLKKDKFLPLLDNEVEHPKAARYKENFLKTKTMVMIGGEDDGVIEPWESTHFGFYEIGSDERVLHVRHTKAYTDDLYGLKTLDERGGLVLKSISGVGHLEWHHDLGTFQIAILPYL